MTDYGGYRFYFGTYGGTYGNKTLRPWELKHVTGITMSLTGNTSIINVVGRPAKSAQIFDTAGPVRSFTITGIRNEHEEDVSNWDFIHNEFNTVNGLTYVGLDWLDSKVQTTMRGYVFSIQKDSNSDNRFITGMFNVSINGFSYNFVPDKPYNIEYTINLVERRQYGSKIY